MLAKGIVYKLQSDTDETPEGEEEEEATANKEKNYILEGVYWRIMSGRDAFCSVIRRERGSLRYNGQQGEGSHLREVLEDTGPRGA